MGIVIFRGDRRLGSSLARRDVVAGIAPSLPLDGTEQHKLPGPVSS
jgi:hypothetical protein